MPAPTPPSATSPTTPPVIYVLVKIGEQAHMEEMRRTGRLRMQRLSAFQALEDNVGRGDPNEGAAALFQSDRVTLTIGGHQLQGLVGPIRLAYNEDLSKHMFCFHAVTSGRFPAFFEEQAPV